MPGRHDLTLDDGNPGLAGKTGPFGTVTVSLIDSTHAAVEADSLSNGGFLYMFGQAGALGLNVNGPFTIGSVTESNSLGSPFTATFSGSGAGGHEDGFGVFALNLDNAGGFFASATQINVMLTLTSGTWATSGSVLTANGSGNFAAGHFLPESPNCKNADGALQTCGDTGFAAATGITTQSSTPEPLSLASVGLGLLALGSLRRRRRVKKAQRTSFR